MTSEIRAKVDELCAGLKDEIEGLDVGSKEHQTAVGDLVKLLETANKDDEMMANLEDSRDRREIERDKNATMAKLEVERNKLSWPRAGLEIAKVILPTLLSIGAYSVFQHRVLKFEETGRIVSTAGRSLSLPKFFK